MFSVLKIKAESAVKWNVFSAENIHRWWKHPSKFSEEKLQLLFLFTPCFAVFFQCWKCFSVLEYFSALKTSMLKTFHFRPYFAVFFSTENINFLLGYSLSFLNQSWSNLLPLIIINKIDKQCGANLHLGSESIWMHLSFVSPWDNVTDWHDRSSLAV